MYNALKWGDKLLQKLKNSRGEGYIDVIVTVLISMMVVLLAVGTFSMIIEKVNLDHFGRELIRTAEVSGRIGSDVNSRYSELQAETGLSPVVNWQTSYYNVSNKSIQLREDITLYLELHTSFKGLGGFVSVPVTLRSMVTGKSERYWK
jgi:hypothetical protein